MMMMRSVHASCRDPRGSRYSGLAQVKVDRRRFDGPPLSGEPSCLSHLETCLWIVMVVMRSVIASCKSPRESGYSG